MRINDFGQPIGEEVPGWTVRPRIEPVTLEGRTCRVEPLGENNLDVLHQALDVDTSPRIWTYISSGPYDDRAGLAGHAAALHAIPDCEPHAILAPDGSGLGIACYLRIDPANGSAEVGGIVMSAALQRTTAATESMYLMMRHVFDDLGYRRYEWKCDSLNEPSRRAAVRYGFRYEGRFRSAMVYKGRNRDTDWFCVTDAEWALLRPSYDVWLGQDNFDGHGRQRVSLSALTGSLTG
ncbi:MAG: GNAT family N-acetyltransferase [Actinomycetota bacterium]|nr:GNAT family N-acetyltransferase [Actinomycetota bacterium]